MHTCVVRTFRISSDLATAPEAVWRHVTDLDGVNGELAPLLRMTVPPGLEHARLDQLPIGRRAGRSWLLLFGFLPVDFDDLTIAEFGPGIYGIGAASDIYFGKEPGALNVWETALLAAALPNPKALKIRNPSNQLRDRQAWIIKQVQRLRREGWLTRIEIG